MALLLASACRSGTAAQDTGQDTGQDPGDRGQRAREQIREQLGGVPTRVDTAIASALSNAFRAAADRALPAVVQVTVERGAQVAGRSVPVPDMFRYFFGLPEGGPDQQIPLLPQQSTGSGFIFDQQGHIVTNNHVVADAEQVRVRLVDGREYAAEVVGTDPSTDVAVLEVRPREEERLPVLTFADSDSLRVGDWVLALGNPLGLDFSVTAGIVSARGRQITGRTGALEAFIQTDAAVNPGNSGGPLVDLLGRVVGVNTAIVGGPRFVGYGFAVPIDLARRVVNDLLEYGYVRRPRLGVSVSDVTAVDAEAYGLDRIAGAEVNTVEAGSPADRAGIEVGDVVVALDGRPVDDATALTTALARRHPGERVRLAVIRDRVRRDVTVELGEFERPPAVARRGSGQQEGKHLLGFDVRPLTPELAARFGLGERQGVVVTDVVPFGPAASGGLRPGQLILQINGEKVARPEDVDRIAAKLSPGTVASVRVRDPQLGETIVNYRVER
jgi:Do/DeqQ family serine protease